MNLNILLACIYCWLIIFQIIISKRMVKQRIEEIKRLSTKLKQLINSKTTSKCQQKKCQNQQKYDNGTLKQFLYFGINHHMISKIYNSDFSKRIYEMFIIGIIINVYFCQGDLNKFTYSIIGTSIIQIAILFVLNSLKNKSRNTIYQIFQDQKDQLQKQINVETGVLEIQLDQYLLQKYSYTLFYSQIAYSFISIPALIILSSRFFLINTHSLIQLQQIKIIAIFLCIDLLLIRPFLLLFYGMFLYLFYLDNKKQFCENHPQIAEIIFLDIWQQQQTGFVKNNNNHQNKNNKERVEIILQEHTQQAFNTIPNEIIHLDQIKNQYTQHKNQLGNLNEINNPIILDTLKPLESHKSPLNKLILNSERDIDTIKKQLNKVKCVQISQSKLNNIPHFNINKYDNTNNQKTIDYNINTGRINNQKTYKNNEQNKENGLQNHFFNQHQSKVLTEKSSSNYLIENQSNQIINSKISIITNTNKQQSYYQNNDDSKIYQNSQLMKFSSLNENQLKQLKKKHSNQNKRIHLLYTTTQQSQNDRRNQNLKQKECQESIIQHQKQNMPTVKNAVNLKTKQFIYNSMELPNIKPLDILMVRQNKKPQDNIEFLNEQMIQKKKKKKKSTKRNRQQLLKEKSPYLEFLPKMLKKEQMQRNQSCVQPYRQKIKPTDPRRIIKKNNNNQLIVIKKTLPSEIQTLYT